MSFLHHQQTLVSRRAELFATAFDRIEANCDNASEVETTLSLQVVGSADFVQESKPIVVSKISPQEMLNFNLFMDIITVVFRQK